MNQVYVYNNFINRNMTYEVYDFMRRVATGLHFHTDAGLFNSHLLWKFDERNTAWREVERG